MTSQKVQFAALELPISTFINPNKPFHQPFYKPSSTTKPMAQDYSEATMKKIRRLGKMLNALERISPSMAGKLAFRVFCSPRRMPMRERDAAFLATGRREFLHLGNHKISTYTWPSSNPKAKTALLLHGWESSSARWRKYVKAFQEAGFSVQAIDAPASGYSQGKRLNVILFSQVIRDYIAKKGVPHVMVGHSLGGAAAIMSTTLGEAPAPTQMVLMGVFAESTRVIHDFASLLNVNQGVVKAIFKEIEKRSGIPIEAYSVTQKAALLKNVHGLVIHDTDDAVAPVSEGRAVADAWEAVFLQTEGLGHRLQDKTVISAVVEFSKKELLQGF